MSTFWRRIRERMFGALPDGEGEDVEIGAIDDFASPFAPVEVEGYGSTVEIRYSGALTQSEGPLFVHFGIGPGAWTHVSEAPMQPTEHGAYQAEIGVADDDGRLEFCFRNDLGEWDNNDGNNWSYPL